MNQMIIIVLHKNCIKWYFFLFIVCSRDMSQLLNKRVAAKKRHTTPNERAQILLSLQNGHTTREVAKAQKIAPSTVSRIKKRWLETNSLEDLARTGRPPTVKEPTQRRIVNLITSRRCSSAVEVQN